MSWTYSGDPSLSDRDKVRFLVFDTDVNEQLINDEEIAWVLTEQSNIYMAAANVAEAIAAKFAKDINRSAVGLSASPGGRGRFYLDLADKLRSQAATVNTHGEIFAGGLSIAGKAALNSEADDTQPTFKTGQFDYPGGS
jgi:hypothetical protein